MVQCSGTPPICLLYLKINPLANKCHDIFKSWFAFPLSKCNIMIKVLSKDIAVITLDSKVETCQ